MMGLGRGGLLLFADPFVGIAAHDVRERVAGLPVQVTEVDDAPVAVELLLGEALGAAGEPQVAVFVDEGELVVRAADEHAGHLQGEVHAQLVHDGGEELAEEDLRIRHVVLRFDVEDTVVGESHVAVDEAVAVLDVDGPVRLPPGMDDHGRLGRIERRAEFLVPGHGLLLVNGLEDTEGAAFVPGEREAVGVGVKALTDGFFRAEVAAALFDYNYTHSENGFCWFVSRGRTGSALAFLILGEEMGDAGETHDAGEESVEAHLAGGGLLAIDAELLPPGADGGHAGAGDDALALAELDGTVGLPVLDVDVASLGLAAHLDAVDHFPEGGILGGDHREADFLREVAEFGLGAVRVYMIAAFASAHDDVLAVGVGVVLYEIGVEPDELFEVALALDLRRAEDLLGDMHMKARGAAALGKGQLREFFHGLGPEVDGGGVHRPQRDGLHLDRELTFGQRAVGLTLEPVRACLGDLVVRLLVSGVQLQFDTDAVGTVVFTGRVETAVSLIEVVVMTAAVQHVAGVHGLDQKAVGGVLLAGLVQEEVVVVDGEDFVLRGVDLVTEDYTVTAQEAVDTHLFADEHRFERIPDLAGDDADGAQRNLLALDAEGPEVDRTGRGAAVAELEAGGLLPDKTELGLVVG